MSITGSCHCGVIAFTIDGDIPASLTRCTCSRQPCIRAGWQLGWKHAAYPVNARLFDEFDAAQAPVAVIDGKHLW